MYRCCTLTVLDHLYDIFDWTIVLMLLYHSHTHTVTRDLRAGSGTLGGGGLRAVVSQQYLVTVVLIVVVCR